jgi:hypothetical protein
VGVAAAAVMITTWGGIEMVVPVCHERRAVPIWENFVDMIGEDVAQKVMKHWRGTTIYIPSCKAVFNQVKRDAERTRIRAAFDHLTGKEMGLSARQATFRLALDFGMGTRNIERIINKETRT